jgi:hypothetical protein
MIAFAFLQYRRLKTARREKKNQWPAASTDIARNSPSHHAVLLGPRIGLTGICEIELAEGGVVSETVEYDLRAVARPATATAILRSCWAVL